MYPGEPQGGWAVRSSTRRQHTPTNPPTKFPNGTDQKNQSNQRTVVLFSGQTSPLSGHHLPHRVSSERSPHHPAIISKKAPTPRYPHHAPLLPPATAHRCKMLASMSSLSSTTICTVSFSVVLSKACAQPWNPVGPGLALSQTWVGPSMEFLGPQGYKEMVGA